MLNLSHKIIPKLFLKCIVAFSIMILVMTNLYWSEEMGDAFEKIFEAKATSPTMASDYVQIGNATKSCAYPYLKSGDKEYSCHEQLMRTQGGGFLMIDTWHGWGLDGEGSGDPNSKLQPFIAHHDPRVYIGSGRSDDQSINRYKAITENKTNTPIGFEGRAKFDKYYAKNEGGFAEFTMWSRSVTDFSMDFENVSMSSIQDITMSPCMEYPEEYKNYPWLNAWALHSGDITLESYLKEIKQTYPTEYSHIQDDLNSILSPNHHYSTNWRNYSDAAKMLGLRKYPQIDKKVKDPLTNYTSWIPNPDLAKYPNGKDWDYLSSGLTHKRNKDTRGEHNDTIHNKPQRMKNLPLPQWLLNDASNNTIWDCDEVRIDEAFRLIFIPEDLYNRPDAEQTLPIDSDKPTEIAMLNSAPYNSIIRTNFYGHPVNGNTLRSYKIESMHLKYDNLYNGSLDGALEARGINKKSPHPRYLRRAVINDLSGNRVFPDNVGGGIDLDMNNYLKDHNDIPIKERLKDNLSRGIRNYKVLLELFDVHGGRSGTISNVFLRFYGKKAGKVKIESVEYLCTNDFGTVRFIVKASSPGNRIASGLFHLTPNDEAYKPENVKTIGGTRSANPTPADAGTSPEGDAMVAFDMSFAMSFEESKRFFQDGMRVFAGITDDLGNMNEGADANNLPLIHTTGDSHFNKCGVPFFQTMGGDFRSKEPITSGGANKYNKVWLGQKANANDVDNMKFINNKKYRPVNPNVSDFTFEQGGDTAGCPGIATGINPTRQNIGDFCFQVNSNGITHDAMYSDISSGLQNISQVYKLTGSYTKYELSKIFTSNRDFNRELPTVLDVSAFDKIEIIDDIPADKNAKVIVYSSKTGSNIQVRAAFAKVELDEIKTDRVSYRERNNSTRFRMYINSGDVGSIELVPLNKEAVNVYEGAMFARTNFITSQANKTDIVRGLVVANGVVAQSTKGSDSKNADLYFKDFTHPILLIDFDAQYLIFRGFGGSDGDTVEREHIGL